MSPVIKSISETPWHGSSKAVYAAAMIRQALVFDPATNQHYIMSENTGLKETLFFHSDKEGNITEWGEVGGGKHLTLEECVAQFRELLHTFPSE